MNKSKILDKIKRCVACKYEWLAIAKTPRKCPNCQKKSWEGKTEPARFSNPIDHNE